MPTVTKTNCFYVSGSSRWPYWPCRDYSGFNGCKGYDASPSALSVLLSQYAVILFNFTFPVTVRVLATAAAFPKNFPSF